jgi:hypothetical protein
LWRGGSASTRATLASWEHREREPVGRFAESVKRCLNLNRDEQKNADVRRVGWGRYPKTCAS